MTVMADKNGGTKPSASSATGAYAINFEVFSKRLKQFYTHWGEHNSDAWGASDAVVIATPPPSDDLRYLKSSALNIWLFGYEFPETLMVFMSKQIHFLCSQKKATLLETVRKSAKEAVGADVVMHVKAKNDDGAALMEELFRAVRSQSKSDHPVIGYIAKEVPEGKLLETWSGKLASSGLKLSDVTNGFSELFAVKDATELTCVKKAAHLTSSVFKYFVVPQLEKTIDEEKKVTHSSLMEATEKAILDPSKVKVKLKAENIDICYPPIFQSGGMFDLKPSASSNDDNLFYDSASVIISAIGSRYSSYCSNIARTFIIDATSTHTKAYDVLLKAHDAAIAMLKPGNKVSAAYQAAVSVVEKEAPELLPNLTKSAGTGIGLEFRESGLNLNMNNERLLKAGMVFNVSLGFQNLQVEAKNPKTERFSLLLADTVIVSSEKPPEVLTAGCSKSVRDIAYAFNEDQGEEERPKRNAAANNSEPFSSKATLRSGNNEATREELRKQHQAELARQKNEETARRLAGGELGIGDRRGPVKTSGELVAYKSVNDIPPSKELAIQLDQKNEAILLPIYGSMVPFHVSTVKSVTSHQDNRTCTIRIIFNVPGTAFNPHDANSLKNQGAIYLKEVTFRSKDPRHSNEVVGRIKLLRRQVASRESERAERATLVTQEKLQLAVFNSFVSLYLSHSLLWSGSDFEVGFLVDYWNFGRLSEMGFISRKILPACGSMCVCCPALRPSSRRPVKRYKKLLAEIFPKTIDGPPNERKITKLCEYALKNPHRIPKIAKFFEQRSYKELRTENINFIKIITEIYCKLLYICKEQMAYFASSLLNVIVELLNHKKQEAVQILGCQSLTSFVYSQADSTYAHNIESLVQKVCMLACEDGDEHRRLLRAASLQCLSAMVWFMTEYSHIFTDLDEIIHAVLQNYGIEEHIEDSNQRRETHHNWVDEVVRCEVRVVGNAGTDVSRSATPIMPRPGTMDSSKLTSEECQSPEVWSHICIQKLAELAKESTTMRRVLEPMISYFDNGRHWAAGHGLALHVLSVMSYLVKSPGNEQMILASIIRHLDHKNVVHDPRIKSDIVQIATCLVRQLESQSGVAEIAVASDLCRHLRKSLQATMESLGPLESNWNEALQNSIEDCLLEIAKGIGDAYPLFDMMAITLEKLPAAATVARATIESLLIVAHIISSTSVNSHPQLVFPEALLLQLIKTMMHPDVETRVGAHQIFSVILVRSATYPRHGYEHRKWQSKSTAAFASATALFEKLRREKECFNDDISIKDMIEEEAKNGRSRKTSPYFHKLSSVIDRTVVSTCPAEAEANIITLNEDQTAQLLSALWLQANQPDNLPSNFEAIAHSFSLTLLSSRFKNSNHCNTVRFFQLPLSLLKASLEPKGILRPSCRRSLLTLASAKLAFAGKIYQMTDLTDALKFLISLNVDPYLRIGGDLQIYIMPQLDLKDFGSETDQQSAKPLLADFRNMVVESGQYLLDIIVRDISKLTNLEKDELAQQLSETFTPEFGPLCSSIPAYDWDTIQAFGPSEESLSLDEESSRTSSVDGDMISESTATDLPRFISRIPTKPPLSPVIGVGQLLESALHVAGLVAGTSVSTSPLPYGAMASQCDALGMGMRKKLSTWLVDGHDSVPDVPLPTLHVSSRSGIAKIQMDGYGSRKKVSEQLQALRLPPASPFDNFMRAAGC